MKKYLLFLVLLSAFVSYAQEITVLQQEIPAQVPFARPFAAQVVLSNPIGQTIQLAPEQTSTEFAITQATFDPITPDKTQADLTVLPLTLGKSTFTVSFALQTNPQQTVAMQAPLTVTPVQLFKDKELKEIRAPHSPINWLLWICVLLALIALICLLIWWIRQIKKDATLLAAEQDKRPPHVIALSQIDTLVDSGLWEKKQYKLFYITLTDILRTYLQKAFGLDVSADTSVELLRRIKTQAQFNSFVQGLREFLASGDLVKFAKAQPTETTRNQDISFLRHFITQTAPKPQPQTPKKVEVKV